MAFPDFSVREICHVFFFAGLVDGISLLVQLQVVVMMSEPADAWHKWGRPKKSPGRKCRKTACGMTDASSSVTDPQRGANCNPPTAGVVRPTGYFLPLRLNQASCITPSQSAFFSPQHEINGGVVMHPESSV